jgi:hypothetical protein
LIGQWRCHFHNVFYAFQRSWREIFLLGIGKDWLGVGAIALDKGLIESCEGWIGLPTDPPSINTNQAELRVIKRFRGKNLQPHLPLKTLKSLGKSAKSGSATSQKTCQKSANSVHFSNPCRTEVFGNGRGATSQKINPQSTT